MEEYVFFNKHVILENPAAGTESFQTIVFLSHPAVNSFNISFFVLIMELTFNNESMKQFTKPVTNIDDIANIKFLKKINKAGKMSADVNARFTKYEEPERIIPLRIQSFPVNRRTHIADLIINKIRQEIDFFEGTGSGLSFQGLESIDIKFIRSNTGGDESLPSFLVKNCRALVTVRQNKRNRGRCFMHAVMASVFFSCKKKNASHYEENYYGRFHWSGLAHGVGISEWECITFGKNNRDKYDIDIMKYNTGDPKGEFSVIYRWKKDKTKPLIAVLLASDHFYPIVNYSRLISRPSGRYILCYVCSKRFISPTELEKHEHSCMGSDQMISFPNKKIKYEYHMYELYSRWVIYSDIECIVTREGIHQPAAISYIIVERDPFSGELSKEIRNARTFMGVDCVDSFLLSLSRRNYSKKKRRCSCNPPKIHAGKEIPSQST